MWYISTVGGLGASRQTGPYTVDQNARFYTLILDVHDEKNIYAGRRLRVHIVKVTFLHDDYG